MPEEIVELDPEIAAVVTEAKESFDLMDRLRGRGMRSGSITVYTDELVGEKHFDVETKLDKLSNRVQHLGVLLDAAAELELPEAVDALRNLVEKAKDGEFFPREEFDRLTEEAAELKAEMARTSLTFNLRAVPSLVVKDARRKARKRLGIATKGISEDLEEQFQEWAAAYVLADMTTSYIDVATGTEVRDLSVEYAHALGDLLPDGEFQRLSAKLNDLQFKNVVTESVVSSPDFSQGI